MVGNLPGDNNQGGDLAFTTVKRLYVPFQFWFNRNPGLALPLIALQYHEVKLNLELRPFADLVDVTVSAATQPSSGFSCKLYVDYVYLDTDERRRFAQVSHEYLIEQVQFTGSETIASRSTNKNITLNFNHPVKELVWAHVSTLHNTTGTTVGNCCWFNYSGENSENLGADSFQTGLLQLNGHDRFSVRNADYFRKVQNYEHHTRVPRVGTDVNGVKATAGVAAAVTAGTLFNTSVYRKQYIYSYSFALSPEEHQPSGTCNFSRIDNAVLQLTYNANGGTPGVDSTGRDYQDALYDGAFTLNIYAVNYNVLRIMSGMGGLAYSN
jgi:hypothetical protein